MYRHGLYPIDYKDIRLNWIYKDKPGQYSLFFYLLLLMPTHAAHNLGSTAKSRIKIFIDDSSDPNDRFKVSEVTTKLKGARKWPLLILVSEKLV
jgi:hypothetical protein